MRKTIYFFLYKHQVTHHLTYLNLEGLLRSVEIFIAYTITSFYPRCGFIFFFLFMLKYIYFYFIEYAKAVDCVDHNKLWTILKELGIPDYLTCLLRNLYAG